MKKKSTGSFMRMERFVGCVTARWGVASRTGAFGSTALLSDITARKLAEQEAARIRAVLQATVDSIPFNCFAVGPDGRYMLQNAASKKDYQADIVGKRPEEAWSAAP